MSSHSIDADIKVKWAEGQSAYSPSTPEELLLIAIDLLVRDRAAKQRAASSSRCSSATPRTPLLQSSQALAEQVEKPWASPSFSHSTLAGRLSTAYQSTTVWPKVGPSRLSTSGGPACR